MTQQGSFILSIAGEMLTFMTSSAGIDSEMAFSIDIAKS